MQSVDSTIVCRNIITLPSSPCPFPLASRIHMSHIGPSSTPPETTTLDLHDLLTGMERPIASLGVRRGGRRGGGSGDGRRSSHLIEIRSYRLDSEINRSLTSLVTSGMDCCGIVKYCSCALVITVNHHQTRHRSLFPPRLPIVPPFPFTFSDGSGSFQYNIQGPTQFIVLNQRAS